MSLTPAQLKRERHELIRRAQAMLRRPSMSAADEREFDELMQRIDELDDRILELEERELPPTMSRVLAGLNTGADSPRRESPELRAFDRFLRNGLAALNADDRAIMLRRVSADVPMIRAAQGVGTGAAGGFTVPDEAMRPIVEALKAFGGLLQFATVIETDTGADLPIPTDDETLVEGEIVAENAQHNEQDITFSQITLQSFLYSSKIVRVSWQLLQDSSVDIPAYVGRKLGARIGRISSKHWISGDGVSKPRGIVTAAPTGKTAASATAITYDELVDLMSSVDPAYQSNARWLMNQATLFAIRKLKDTQNRPIFGADVAAATPNTLLGKEVVIDQSMPNIAASQAPIVYGDLSSYFVRMVRGSIRVLRLEERYADFGQVGFLGFARMDGDLVDAGAGAVKKLVMASA